MNAKTLATLAVLAAVGIGLYLKINSLPEPKPPQDFTGTWGNAPQIEMGAPVGGGAVAHNPAIRPGGSAPAFTPGDMAPPFAANTAAPPFSASPGAANANTAAPPFAASTAGGLPPLGPPSGSSGAPGAAGSRDPFLAGGAQAPTASPSQPGGASFADAWRKAQEKLDANQLAEALEILTVWYPNPSLSEGEERQLVQLLSQLAGTVIYSTGSYMEPEYKVDVNGETIAEIADRCQVPASLLANINGFDAQKPLPSGTKVKVLRGPFSAKVYLERHEMVLTVSGHFAGRFPIGVGQERPNMEGDFVVTNKEQNRPYYGRDRVIDAGDPANPLGAYWLGLAQPGDTKMGEPFGIHGTNDPAGLSHADPRGFIRLAPSDVKDAFDILSVGSNIVIRR